MAPFSFLQRSNLVDQTKQFSLASYVPRIELEGLTAGVDNIRHDVYLSPKTTEATRQHIARLIVKYGDVEDLAREEPVAPLKPPSRILMSGAPPPASNFPAWRKGEPVPEPADFKRLLRDLHVASLNRAKADNNVSVDLLARLAIVKSQRAEMATQFARILERCRIRLKSCDNPAPHMLRKTEEVRQRFARLQVGKKSILRRVGQDLFSTLRELDKETLAKMRRSLLGDVAADSYDLFVNRLLFTEDGRDDYVNAEHYVMLGNFERDVDRFQTLLEICSEFLRSIGVVGEDDDQAIDGLLSAPGNSQELVAGGIPDETTQRGKAQRAVLNAFVEMLERKNVMEQVIASYEAVPLLGQYCPPINPQQLKNALISRSERRRVETLLEEHGKISATPLHSAVKKVEICKAYEKAKIAGRFLGDFIRYHRDLRRLEVLSAAMDTVNVISNEKLRQLSQINNTLYEFLLPEEQSPAEEKIVGHVVVKADVRDSTMLIRSLYERGLNPASYFSLNFFEPVNALLTKYSAAKVFIEGDAVILALFEREGAPGFGVSRSCVLAKEVVKIVGAHNDQSRKVGLPTLEVGLGLSYQDSSPMYLMDGNNRIMISPALNESDRLCSSTRGARRFLGDFKSLFNVHAFQIVADEDTGGTPDEFLVRYNIGGIHMSVAAFKKLETEISLKLHEIELPMIWGQETIRLHSGVVPVAAGVFHELIVREGQVAHVDAHTFALNSWAPRRYYEVCTNPEIYELIQTELPPQS